MTDHRGGPGVMEPGRCTEEGFTASQDPTGKSFSYFDTRGRTIPARERQHLWAQGRAGLSSYLQNSLGATKTRQCFFLTSTSSCEVCLQWGIYKGLLLATAQPTAPVPMVREELKQAASVLGEQCVQGMTPSLPSV